MIRQTELNMRLTFRLILCLPLLLAGHALPALAQSFSPAIKVNDRVITEYELDQRTDPATDHRRDERIRRPRQS